MNCVSFCGEMLECEWANDKVCSPSGGESAAEGGGIYSTEGGGGGGGL